MRRSPLSKAADSTGPERAVVRIINQSTQLLTYAALTDEAMAAAARGPQALINHLPWEEAIVKLGETVDPISGAVGKAAIAEAGKIEAKLAFNTVDALSQKYGQEQAGQLIRNITDTQRATIRDVLGKSLGGDLTKDQAARQIRQSIGLHPAWAQAVRNFETRQLATVPKGYSPARWQATVAKRTDAYYNRLLRRRADNIARTEIITAENLGRYGTWADSIGRGLNGADSRKEWSPGPGACRICQKHAGEIVQWDQPFSGGLMMPPGHPSCRCTAVLLPAPYENPALRPRTIDWLNPTGHRQVIDFEPYDRGFQLLDDVPTGAPAAPTATMDQTLDRVVDASRGVGNDDYKAINEYGNYGYEDLNAQLRAGARLTDKNDDLVRKIDDAFAKQEPLKQDITVYRGTRIKDLENQTGKDLLDRAYMSTSADRAVANQARFIGDAADSVLMEIRVPAGQRVVAPNISLGGAQDKLSRTLLSINESEILLPRGTVLRVTDDIIENGRRIIRAEVRTELQDGPDLDLPPARVKATKADELTYDSTLHWSDDKLYAQMAKYADDDPEAFDKILDIIDLRAAAEAERAAREARLIAGFQEQQKLDAAAKPYAQDVNPATNPAAKPTRNLNARQRNEEEYQQYIGSQINRALEDLNGVFYNNKMHALAREKGITEESLFTGPYHVAQKYASEELKEWWQANGRETLGSFRYRVFQRPTDYVHAQRVQNLGHSSGQARSTREYGL